jgi:Glutathione S-transferase, N-terminal domain
MKVRLFSMPGSHAAVTGQLLFDHKGINYKRTDLLPVVSWAVLKALRFPDVTVPAATIDGERVQGTRAIARELGAVSRSPRCFLPMRSEDGPWRRLSALATRSSSNHRINPGIDAC